MGYRMFIILFLLLSPASTLFGEAKYPYAAIPKELLTNAKAVVRKSESVFEIYDINKATEKIKLAITILNQNGIELSEFTQFYDKFISIRNFSWELYDKDGNKVRKDSKAQLTDYSAIAGYSLYEDNRVKYLNPNFRNTPFTIEIEYEIVFDGLLWYPSLEVYPDYNVSVENMSFKVLCPKNLTVRYLEENMTDSCSHSFQSGKEGSGKIFSWKIKNKPALKIEPYSPPFEKIAPSVRFAPADFELDGHKGNLESWKNFGLWINSLNKDRDILPKESADEILNLVKGKTNDFEKISTLYSYLQEKVRYVNITVGIGGWQPIEAGTVHRLSYGDCKALSNYMHTLLNLVGIKNFYTLVFAGDDEPDIHAAFPSNNFNHIIVCVPGQSDTIWLECTSQHLPCGFLGKFTDNRHVLLIGKDGGTLVKTKHYSQNDNLRIRKVSVDVSVEGSGISSVKTIYKGLFYDDVYFLMHVDNSTRDKYLFRRIAVKSFNISNISYSEQRNIIPSVTETYNLELPNYCTLSGNRIIFNPNIISKFDSVPSHLSERKFPVYLDRPYSCFDTVIFRIPEFYKAEQLPENRSFSTRFGSYSAEYLFNGKEIRYIRTLTFNSGEFPSSDYNEFINFCEKIVSLDERKVILGKAL